MPATIYSVTLNPALDESLAIDSLTLGGTNRCAFNGLDPGGKGVNASRVIHRLGRPTLALGFAGGVSGAFLTSALEQEGVPHAFDLVDGFTRVNVMLYERSSTNRTRIYLPGPTVTGADIERLKSRLAMVASGELVVFGGSLPPGSNDRTYAELMTWLRDRGARCIVDTSGDALAHALRARPLLVKPNVEEAEELLGRRLSGEKDVIEAVLELCARGAEYAVISRGEAGAIGAGPEGVYNVFPSSLHVTSAVGAGDSMTGGMAIALNEGMDFAQALRWGSACGVATTMTSGTKLCDAQQVYRLLDGVRLEQLVSS